MTTKKRTRATGKRPSSDKRASAHRRQGSSRTNSQPRIRAKVASWGGEQEVRVSHRQAPLAIASEVIGAKGDLAAERLRDERLPPVGTKLVKRDRRGTVRAECEVEADGIRYAGVVYRSLSAAASAAAKELGLKAAVNGFSWWGLVKTTRPAMNPAERLRNLGLRYEERARSFLTATPTEEVAPTIREQLEKHAARVQRLLNEHAV